MTPSARRALNRFEKAVRDHAFIGAAHPNDQRYIEREYENAKKALEKQLTKEKTNA